MKTTTEENTTMNTTTTRTLIQLAEAAQALAAGAGTQAIPLMVTQEEKKLLFLPMVVWVCAKCYPQ